MLVVGLLLWRAFSKMLLASEPRSLQKEELNSSKTSGALLKLFNF